MIEKKTIKNIGLGADNNMSSNPYDWIDLINRFCVETGVQLTIRLIGERISESNNKTKTIYYNEKGKKEFSYSHKPNNVSGRLIFNIGDEDYITELVDFGYPPIPKKMLKNEKKKK